MITDADLLTTLEPRDLPAVVLGNGRDGRMILARFRTLDNAVSLALAEQRKNPAIWFRVGYRWCGVDPLSLAACPRTTFETETAPSGGPDVPDATRGIVGDSGVGPITKETV